METRKCKSCCEEYTKEHFSPSLWDLPLTRNIECRKCISDKASAKVRINKDFKGELYIICNKAWEGWCKIGLTTKSVDERLMSYQTGSPFRDYYSYWTIKVDDVFKAEKSLHMFLEDNNIEKSYEWFKITPEIAKDLMVEYFK